MQRLFILFLLCIVLQTGYGHKKDTLLVKEIEFVENRQQWDNAVLFKAKLSNGAVFAEQNCITYAILNGKQLHDFYQTKVNPTIQHSGIINGSAYKVHFMGGNEMVQVRGTEQTSYYQNYFIGKDQNKWASKVPVYHSIVYENLYNEIDLQFYQQEQYLKYEFVVKVGGNPNDIRLRYEGVKNLTLQKEELIVGLEVGQVMELKPIAYQINEQGDTLSVECHYILRKDEVAFQLGHYDTSLPLTIDPTLIFSSYSGSSADNWGYTATYDLAGNLYGGGIVHNVGYPITVGAFQVNFAGGDCDIAISKFDALGSFLHYSTYLGGTDIDMPHSMFVNGNNELYLYGTTGSADFPVTPNAYDTSFHGGSRVVLSTRKVFVNGSDMIISKFNQDGTTLLASTYIGGSGNDGLNTGQPLCKNYADDNRGEIVIDKNSNVYVVSCTFSTDFPVTSGVFQPLNNGGKEACILKMNHNLTNMIWSSYYGGNGQEAGYSIELSSDQSLYICGGTNSLNLPITQNAYQTTYGGGSADGFIAHISKNGNQLLQATYFGKSGYDQTYLVKSNRADFPHVYGQTDATGSAWIENAPWYILSGGQFITKFSPLLDTIIWSTTFGTGNGGPDISPTALLVDLCQNIYMSGWGSNRINGFGGTSGLPITADAFQSTTDNNDYYFICISDDASSLVYGTYFGSPFSDEHVDGGTSRFDNKGRIYQAVCAGCGGDDHFPTTPGAWSRINGSTNCNLGVIKLDFNLPLVIAEFDMPNTVCTPATISLANHSQTIGSQTSFYWDFGDGTNSTEISPVHTYSEGGLYDVMLIVSDMGSCNFADTLIKTLLVLTNSTDTLATKNMCNGDFVQIGIPPSGNPDITYNWTPNLFLSNSDISNPIAYPDTTTIYTLIVGNQFCSDTLLQKIEVSYLSIASLSDTTICLGDSAVLSIVSSEGTIQSVIWSTDPSFNTIINTDLLQTVLTISPSVTTTYYVKIRGAQCIITGQATVYVSSVEITETPSFTICFEENITISIGVNAPEGCTYQWAPEAWIVSGSQSATPVINPPGNATYTVTITNPFGCRASGEVQVQKRTSSFPSELEVWSSKNRILAGDQLTLYATDYQDIEYHYQWAPPTDLSAPYSPVTQASPRKNTLFSVTVTDHLGCSKSDSILIMVDPLTCDEPLVFIPNAFTPNGDGKNDILYVRSVLLEKVQWMIYNRWGEKVFETNNLEQGWDGLYKGKHCEPGVYDYYFEGTCTNGEVYVHKGNVTILR